MTKKTNKTEITEGYNSYSQGEAYEMISKPGLHIILNSRDYTRKDLIEVFEGMIKHFKNKDITFDHRRFNATVELGK